MVEGNKIRVWGFTNSENPASDDAVELIFGGFKTLDELSLNLPKGAYTTVRTYHGNKILRFSEHYRRLKESMVNEDHRDLIIESRLKHLMRVAINNTNYTESRIRIIFTDENQPRLLAAIEPLPITNPLMYETGVRVLTNQNVHREQPERKTTDFIYQSKESRSAMPKGINEILMISEGEILEGLSSNFFGVQNGIVKTASRGILAGVTRSIVLDAIKTKGFPYTLEAIRLVDIPSLTEAFITSTSRGVLPVVQIDQYRIGIGIPGELTRSISREFEQRIEMELEEI